MEKVSSDVVPGKSPKVCISRPVLVNFKLLIATVSSSVSSSIPDIVIAPMSCSEIKTGLIKRSASEIVNICSKKSPIEIPV